MADIKGLQRVGWLFAALVACVVTIAAVSTVNGQATLEDGIDRQAAIGRTG